MATSRPNQNGGGPKGTAAAGPGTVGQDELSAEDYAIIAAAFSALGDFFALLSLVKAREATSTGLDINPAAALVSINTAKKRSRKRSRRTL